MRAYAGGGAAAPQRGSHACERGIGCAGTRAYGACERMRAEVQRRHTEALLMLAYAGAGTQALDTASPQRRSSDYLSENRESENQRALTLVVAQEVLVLFCSEATLWRLCVAVEGGCRASICGGCQEQLYLVP